MTEYDGVERSTATDELRRMLDERGVEYEGGERSLRWRDRYGIMMQAFPLANGELGMEVWSCTPEQAIAATLGRGTCRFKTVEQFIDTRRRRSDICECDRCGYRCARGFIHDERFKYCPNCGARIEVGTHERA